MGEAEENKAFGWKNTTNSSKTLDATVLKVLQTLVGRITCVNTRRRGECATRHRNLEIRKKREGWFPVWRLGLEGGLGAYLKFGGMEE